MTEYEKIYEDIADRPGGPYIRLLTLLPGESTLDAMKTTKPEEDWPIKWDEEVGDFVGVKPENWIEEPPLPSDLEVELSAHPLSDCPEYEALSYTWGKETDYKFTIKCNGHDFIALRQMHNALHALRLPDRPRVVWIDAICINQSQYADKNCQLPLMQHIYRNSKRTVIWLGTQYEKNSAPAFSGQAIDLDLSPPDLEGFGRSFETFLAINLETLATDPAELWQDHPEIKPTWEKRLDLIKDAALRVKEEWSTRETPLSTDFNVAIKNVMDNRLEDTQMPKIFRSAGKYLLTRPKYRNTVRQGVALTDEQSTWRMTIRNLLCREWWSRVWIIQEVCLASDITFICGNTTLSMDLLFLGMVLYSVFPDNPLFRGHIISSWTLPQVAEYRVLQRQGGDRPLPGFLHLLSEFRLSDATNPRDHVYALLGLVPPDEQSALDAADYKPDYSKDVSWCYTETAKAICSAAGNLNILSIPRAPARTASTSAAGPLPSWVPDWAMKTDIYPPTHGIESQGAGDAASLFSACGNCIAWPPQIRGDGSLVISGYVTDSIAEVVSHTLPFMQEMMEAMMSQMMDEENQEAMEKKMSSGTMGALDFATDLFAMYGSTISGLVEWEEFVMSKGKAYLTGEDMKQVACAVRCYGYMPDGVEAAMSAFKEYTNAFWWTRKMYNLTAPSSSSTSTSSPSQSQSQSQSTTTATKSKSSFSFFKSKKSKEKSEESSAKENSEKEDSEKKENPEKSEKPEQSKWSKNLIALAAPKNKSKLVKFNSMQVYSLGRKLAWTEKGYLALVPEDTTTGDKIVLCQGSRIPLLVKEAGEPNRWNHLEGCYVHGIMGGEAWNESLCEEMELI